jgi:DNA-binding MarR family transcriptional regulator
MERIEDCFAFLLGKAYQHINQEARQRLAPHGVTPAQYGLLEVLWERDEQSGAELSERLQLDSATMTGLLDRLERAGLVIRRADSTDRRVNRVALTAQGSALRGPLDQAMDAVNAKVLAQLGDERAALLRAMLAELGQVTGPRNKGAQGEGA